MIESLEELMAQADACVRELESFETEFRRLGEIDIQISFDALREELCAPTTNPDAIGALRG